MTTLENWLAAPQAHALGWALAHFVWEGALLALLPALCHPRSARTRYALAAATLFAMPAVFLMTFALLLPAEHAQTVTAVPGRLAAGAPFKGFSAVLPAGAGDRLAWLVPFWAAGMLVCYAHGFVSWAAAGRLRRVGTCAAPLPWQQRLDRLRERLRVVKPVRLLESCLAEAPVVIGFYRPVILVPVGLLTGLGAEQLEAILMHELAHIRRWDYLVNLLQRFVEGLLFYHPAVWWVSGVARAERENCCDDVVVGMRGDAKGYAVALATLERRRSEAVPAATGGSLVKRIRRLLGTEAPAAGHLPVFSIGLLLACAGLAAAAWQANTMPAMSGPYAKWLNEDAAYIISDAERAGYLRLRTDQQREEFIEQFWLRRDPTPGTVKNEFKEEHYRRIAYANRRFSGPVSGWQTERGRVYILYGPPDERETHSNGEQWLYHHIEGIGDNVGFAFSGPGPSTVQLMAESGGRVTITVALGGSGRFAIFGVVRTPERRILSTFEDTIQGQPEYTHSLTLPPGSYDLRIVRKKLETGTAEESDVRFYVR